MENKFDFSGWATKHNIRCSDGRTIMKDAFKDCDGSKVPLVWNHRHSEPESVLGHAILENREEGVYAYCSFNDTESGKEAKELVRHGDVHALSIYANHLKEQSKNVVHGIIREVSLVLAGANPEAFIDSIVMHNDGTFEEDREQGIIYTGEEIVIEHSENVIERSDKKEQSSDNETYQDIFNSLNDKQKDLLYVMLAEALKKDEEDEEDEDEGEKTKKEEPDMKHNVFDKETDTQNNYISHSDEMEIISLAKSRNVGSLKAAIDVFAEDSGILEHTDNGFNNISQLFPDYKDVHPGAPEKLTTDQGWITYLINSVHKSPISRIRTRQADIRNISDLRAKGYIKQGQKGFRGNIDLLYRTTDPQTVYVKSKLDRDDIVDITDFDVVQYMYDIDRANLNEELATAMVLGDGRADGADGKIDPTKIRPIWTDDELYTIHKIVDVAGMRTSLQGTNTGASFGDNYVYAEAIIQSLLYAREEYKGTANPDFFCDPHLLNVMLLARDMNGRRIYSNVEDLKASLNVNKIMTCEQFTNKTRTVTVSGTPQTRKLLAIIFNPKDYALGATKGGEITHFTDFDLNFNQEISLLETRCSGANTRVKSAIVLEEVVVNPS